jgi:hypothetical protein
MDTGTSKEAMTSGVAGCGWAAGVSGRRTCCGAAVAADKANGAAHVSRPNPRRESLLEDCFIVTYSFLT